MTLLNGQLNVMTKLSKMDGYDPAHCCEHNNSSECENMWRDENGVRQFLQQWLAIIFTDYD